MKEFNWEGFRSGKFAVHCDTEEKAREFIKEAHLREIEWVYANPYTTRWNINKSNTCYYGMDTLTYGDIDNCNIKIIEWRNDDMKNFREVIRDIKEGEVWENENFAISIDYDGDIAIDKRNGIINNAGGIWIGSGREFKLKQQPVTFEEVLNSDKRCRVEHNMFDLEELMTEEMIISESNYFDVDEILYAITNKFYTNDTKRILKECKWYLEP